jgi:hypothetical protein
MDGSLVLDMVFSLNFEVRAIQFVGLCADSSYTAPAAARQ